jgi:hypothetical protein
MLPNTRRRPRASRKRVSDSWLAASGGGKQRSYKGLAVGISHGPGDRASYLRSLTRTSRSRKHPTPPNNDAV